MRIAALFALSLCVAAGPVLAAQPDVPVASVDAPQVYYAWANVTRVDPIYRTVDVSSPYQQCQPVTVQRTSSGGHTAATILGAVVGGVLGHTVGKGDGRTAATVAGAVAGGAVGNGVARHRAEEQSEPSTQCQQVASVSQERRIVGYNVEYRYHGRVYMSQLNYDPGERLRVAVSVTPAD